MKSSYVFVIGIVLLASLSIRASAAPPEARNFQAQHMTGDGEVPPRVTPAHGVAVFNLSPDETQLRYNVVVSRMQNVVGGHIHRGTPGVNGPIIFPFFSAAPGGGEQNGVLVKGTLVRGNPLPTTLPGLTHEDRFDALIALMRSGNTYVNIHSNDGVPPTNTGPGDFPGGEIRAQVTPHP